MIRIRAGVRFAGVSAALFLMLSTSAYGRGGIGHIPGLGAAGSGANAAAQEEEAPVASRPVLMVEIRCTREGMEAGDEIPIEFTITNRGAQDYSYKDVDTDALGRAEAFRLMARDEKGAAVADPKAHAPMAGANALVATRTLRPSESFSKAVALNRWALVTSAGKYYITGTYLAGDASHSSFTSGQIEIAVSPRSKEELDAHIDKLAGDLESTATREAKDRIVRELMYTGSPLVIPALVESSFDKGGGGWEAEGLLYYLPRTAETRGAIVDAISKRGLSEGMCHVVRGLDLTCEAARPLIERSLAADNPDAWFGGALCAEDLCDDSFTPRLIEIAKDPSTPARKVAIYALAMNRTDESVAALKSLLSGEDPAARDTAKAAIRAAYNYRGASQGRRLKDDDFDESLRR